MKRNVIAHPEMTHALPVQKLREKYMKSLSNNMVEKLTLSFYDASIVSRDFLCAKCLGKLSVTGEEGSFARNQYFVHCVKCKKDLCESEIIEQYKIRKIEQDKYIGEREMREEKRMSTEQALKDLGFE